MWTSQKMKPWDLTTLGSTMLSLTTEPGAPLLSSEGIRLDIAGAESNCAIALARLGKRVAWHSKVARTSLGERIVSGIRAHGVDAVTRSSPVATRPPVGPAPSGLRWPWVVGTVLVLGVLVFGRVRTQKRRRSR